MTKFSLGILISYFNERELLTRCLKSISKQSVPPDEIIIYDDASSFPAKDYIIAELPVKIIRGDVNKGAGFGRNVLLQTSKCDYVHCHDTDDLFHPLWCEKVREIIEKTNADLVITEIKSFNENGLVNEYVLDLKNRNAAKDLLSFSIKGCILPSASIFKKDIALKIGGFKTRDVLLRSDGYDFHIRLINQCKQYNIIFEPLILKYLHPDALGQDKKICYSEVIKSIYFLKEEIPSRYHQDFAENSARLGSALFYMGDIPHAKEAFRLAFKIGHPKFSSKQFFYRLIARAIGPMPTEYIGMIYRTIIPKKIRKFLSRGGW